MKTKHLALSIVLALLILAPSTSAQGNVYYVAPGGSDDDDGSIDHPWATVEHAGRTAGPGDTVLVRGGTYDEGEIWLRADLGHCGTEKVNC
jgi:hypothetical protein